MEMRSETRKSELCKRLLCAMLVGSMLTGLLGCATTEVETTGKDTQTTVATETEAEVPYIDTLPKKDYDGRAFHFGTLKAYNMAPEELTGETINDAVYNQLLSTRDRYNVDIQIVDVSNELVKNSVQAGDESFQIFTTGTSGGAGACVLTGLVQNLYNFDAIDFTKPWWNQNTVAELTLNDRLYMAFGDICAERGITYTHSFFFNKVMAEDFGINDKVQALYGEDSIYDLVRNGKWTIDAMETLIEGIYVDENGDGKAGFEDTYGLGQSIPVSGVYRTSFDCTIMTRDEEGWPVLNINTEKFNDIVPRIYALCYDNPSVLIGTQAQEGLLAETFTAGQLLLYSGFLCDVDTLREMEDEFGVLPFPKYDEEQSQYYTTVRGDNYFLCIPVTVQESDQEFVGLVTETLAYYGYTLVRQAVYEDTLKGKMVRDDDSIEMLEMVVDGIVIEYAFAHGGGFCYILWNLLDAKKDSFASTYASQEKSALEYYAKLIESYKAIEK